MSRSAAAYDPEEEMKMKEIRLVDELEIQKVIELKNTYIMFLNRMPSARI